MSYVITEALSPPPTLAVYKWHPYDDNSVSMWYVINNKL